MRRLDCSDDRGEDGARQAVGRPVVDEVERVLVARVVVDEGRHHRAEQLVPQQSGNQGRTSRSPSAGRTSPRCRRSSRPRSPEPCRRMPCASSIASFWVANEPASITAPMKFEKSATSPILMSPISSHDAVAHLRPEVRGREDAGGGGALLSLVLERAAQDGGGDRLGVGARVGDDEVLAAGLADDARVVAVAGDVLRRSSSTCR